MWGFEGNFSITIQWIDMEFGSDIHDIGDPLAFHPAPLSVQNFNWTNTKHYKSTFKHYNLETISMLMLAFN